MSNENAAPGGSGGEQTTKVAITGEVRMELEFLASDLKQRGNTLAAEAVQVLHNAAAVLAANGVDPRLAAEALAGGEEFAAGRLFALRLDNDNPASPYWGPTVENLLNCLGPGARSFVAGNLHNWLTDDERRILARTLQCGGQEHTLPTSIPNVRQWFDNLDVATQRKVTEFVRAAGTRVAPGPRLDDANRAAIARVLLRLGADAAAGTTPLLLAPVPAENDQRGAMRLFDIVHALVVSLGQGLYLADEEILGVIQRCSTDA